jgi:CyaY protein
MMTEQEFQGHADQALRGLYQALVEASDTYGFDTEFNGGKLTVEFEDPPAKFVVSPNSPVRQIWVSALVKSFKLDWSEATREFRVGGQSLKELSLKELMASVIGQQLGRSVTL